MKRKNDINDFIIKFFKNWLSLIISIIIILILFSKLNLKTIFNIIKNSDILLLSVSLILALFITFFLVAVVWFIILKELGCRLKFQEVLFMRIGSFPIKAILPMKTGNLSVAYYLKKKHDFSFKKGISFLVYNEFIFFLALAMYFFVGLLYKQNFETSALVLKTISVLIVLILIPFVVFKIKIIKGFFFRTLQKISMRFYLFFKELGYAFNRIKIARTLFFIFLAAIELYIIFIFHYIVFRAVGINISMIPVIAYSPIFMVLSLLPITVSGLGVRESSIVILFSSYSSPESLVSAGLLISLIFYLLPAFIGIAFTGKFLSKMSQ